MNPFIDFSQAEGLPEGISADVLNSEGFQLLLKQQFDSRFSDRFETEAQGLKRTNAELKAEKQAIKERLDRLKDIDPDEYARLQELRKNNGDATKQIERLTEERNAIQQAADLKLKEALAIADKNKQELLQEKFSNKALNAITKHNEQFKAIRVKPGAEKYLVDAARQVFKIDSDGSFTPMNGDRVMTGDSGTMMTLEEWVNHYRSVEPLFYEQPSGGGANGGGAGGKHFNPKNLAGSQPERKSAIGARFPELPD